MILICPCCGAESGERDQANGRCGKCGSFFTGEEQVAPVTEAPVVEPPQVAEEDGDDAPASPEIEPPASGSSAVEPFGAPLDVPPLSDSEELVRPRRLSPQFRRRVEMTWQPSLAPGLHAERTLSAHSANDGTKQNLSSLSIGTRKIIPDRDNGSGDYELTDVIGEGSMGRVWSARQTSLDRNVAVKVPKAELASAGSVGESQFISEVVVTGKLEHPNIVPIYELGRDTNGTPFYSMKHVQGLAWNELIEKKSEQENIEILMKVCDAIAFAHDRDFLHRDIKPHNVIVGEFGEVSVMDWGIAVSLSKDPGRAWAAVASGPAGTPAYMAPEMAAHNPSELGVVSDVYLLGAVLYEIVTGAPPHPRTGDTNEALLAAAANEISPTQKTGELVDIARRAMATNVEDRYQSVQAFQDALREYRSHRESIALADSAQEHLARARRDGDSDEFARARFAYEEALKLWDGNARAVNGLHEATLAYAANALEQGNYPLGLSILDPMDLRHKPLRAQLEVKQRARERKDRQNKILSYSVILLIATLAIGSLFAAIYLNAKRKEADAQKAIALAAEKTANQKKVEADEQRVIAEAAETKAKEEKQQADLARQAAVASRNLAMSERRRAEEASYRAEIGVAAASIRRNSFNKAKEIVDALDTGVKSKLRHWEWAHLQYLLTQSSLRDLPGPESGETVEAVAVVELPTAELPTAELPVNGGAVDQAPILIAMATNRGIRLLQQSAGNAAVELGQEIDTFEASAVAVSPDGQFVVAGITRETKSGDGPREDVVVAWRLEDGKLVDEMTLGRHTAAVSSVAFSRDGKRVLTGSADRTAVLWDFITTRREPATQPVELFGDHSGPVWNAQFSPDDQRVVTACEDGRVRVWTTDGLQLADFSGHQGPVYDAAFLDNDQVVSGGDDRRLLAWRLTMDSEQFERYRDKVIEDAINGERSANSPYAQQEIGQHDASIRCIRAARDNDGLRFLVTGSHDNSLKVWPWPENEVGSRGPIKVLLGHGRWVRACAISPNGQQIVSGGYDGAKLWNWGQYRIPSVLAASFAQRLGSSSVESAPAEVNNATYSPDGKWIASALSDGTVAVWDLQQPTQVVAQQLGNGHRFLASTAAFFDAGASLMTSAGDDTTRLWDVTRSVQTQEFNGTGWRGAAAIAASAPWILTGSDDKRMVGRLWHKANGKWTEIPLGLRRDRQAGEFPETSAVALSADGRLGFIADSMGTGYLVAIDPETQLVELRKSFQCHTTSVTAAHFIDSDRKVMTAGDDGVLRTWDVHDAQLQQELRVGSSIRSLAFDSGEQLALLACSPTLGQTAPRPWNESVVRLVEVATLEPRPEVLSLEQIVDLWNPGMQSSEKLPVVQSAVFGGDDANAILSVYYPTGNRRQRLSRWSWQAASDRYEFIDVPRESDATAAVPRTVDSRDQLLTLGGKGARLWKLVSDTQAAAIPVASFRPQASVLKAVFSADSRRLITAGSDGTAGIWELEDGQWNAKFKLVGMHQEELLSVMFDPRDSNRVLTSSAEDGGTVGKIVVWESLDDAGLWSAKYELRAAGRLQCAAFSPDGFTQAGSIFAGFSDRAVAWHSEDVVGGNLASQDMIDRPVHRIAFSRDGKWIATAGDSTAQVWRAKAFGRPLADLKGHSGMITSLAVSDDRRRILTGSADFTVKLWDTDRLLNGREDLGDDGINAEVQELLTLEKHDGEVTSVAFSPDGTSVLTASQDGQAIVWSGEPVPPSIRTFAPAPDETKRRWSVAPRAVIQAPTRVDFTTAELTVFVKTASDEASGVISNSSQTDSLALVNREEWERLGWRIDESPDRDRLVISQANQQALKTEFEELLRSIIFVYTADPSGQALSSSIERTVVFRLQHIRSALDSAPTSIVDDIEAEVTIEIEPLDVSSNEELAFKGADRQSLIYKNVAP